MCYVWAILCRADSPYDGPPYAELYISLCWCKITQVRRRRQCVFRGSPMCCAFYHFPRTSRPLTSVSVFVSILFFCHCLASFAWIFAIFCRLLFRYLGFLFRSFFSFLFIYSSPSTKIELMKVTLSHLYRLLPSQNLYKNHLSSPWIRY